MSDIKKTMAENRKNQEKSVVLSTFHWMKEIKSLKVLYLIAALGFLPGVVLAAEIETSLYDIDPSTYYPTPETFVKLIITRTDSCFSVKTNSILVDQNNGVVRVSFDIGPADFGICPFPVKLELPIGVLSQEGTYQVYVYQENILQGEYFDNRFLKGVIDVEVIAMNEMVGPETPTEGSIQSGVGLVRGWACNAQVVEIQFDELPRMQTAYGSTRPDTEIVCGDVNNGYGLAYAFGLLGKGLHRMKTFIDGEEVSDVQFEVTGLDDPFVYGLSGTFEIHDFPYPGESVTIRWSEADQNFVIIQHNN